MARLPCSCDKYTERVIRFLKGSPRFPLPLPKFANPAFIALLEEMASSSRQRGNRIHISREKINDRRRYMVCMQLLSGTMREYFNRWFDGEVADLTNIFFPTAIVTIDWSEQHAEKCARQRLPDGQPSGLLIASSRPLRFRRKLVSFPRWVAGQPCKPDA